MLMVTPDGSKGTRILALPSRPNFGQVCADLFRSVLRLTCCAGPFTSIRDVPNLRSPLSFFSVGNIDLGSEARSVSARERFRFAASRPCRALTLCFQKQPCTWDTSTNPWELSLCDAGVAGPLTRACLVQVQHARSCAASKMLTLMLVIDPWALFSVRWGLYVGLVGSWAIGS